MAMRCSTPRILTPDSGFSEFTHSLKTKLSPDQLTKGHQLKNSPIKNIKIERLMTFPQNTPSPASRRRGMTNAIALPTAKRKNGNTKSVGVTPCHEACFKGAYICPQLPGLFTNIINATVAPRKTSRE